jgi:hypothetical protein
MGSAPSMIPLGPTGSRSATSRATHHARALRATANAAMTRTSAAIVAVTPWSDAVSEVPSRE